MVVNEDVYGQLTPERAREIIDEIIVKEAQSESDSYGA
jgi:NADH:ubiquinone oxidoreductase subunit E